MDEKHEHKPPTLEDVVDEYLRTGNTSFGKGMWAGIRAYIAVLAAYAEEANLPSVPVTVILKWAYKDRATKALQNLFIFGDAVVTALFKDNPNAKSVLNIQAGFEAGWNTTAIALAEAAVNAGNEVPASYLTQTLGTYDKVVQGAKDVQECQNVDALLEELLAPASDEEGDK